MTKIKGLVPGFSAENGSRSAVNVRVTTTELKNWRIKERYYGQGYLEALKDFQSPDGSTTEIRIEIRRTDSGREEGTDTEDTDYVDLFLDLNT